MRSAHGIQRNRDRAIRWRLDPAGDARDASLAVDSTAPSDGAMSEFVDVFSEGDVAADDVAADDDALDGLSEADPARPDGTADATCANPCSSEGWVQCGGNAVEICSRIDGCLAWRTVNVCPAAHVCCKGLCVGISDSNCYGCEKKCAGAKPICELDLKDCGCDDASCEAQGLVCDATIHECRAPASRRVTILSLPTIAA
ncbi:MAG TPA: hypothetical protein VJT73_15445 [Polyangiaceae bacterium]|nr:hypothetical protein [Polyangiaceae bacterium]